MNDRITSNTEECLVHCLYEGVNNNENFNDLCYTMYHQKTFHSQYISLLHSRSILALFSLVTHSIDFGYDLSEELLIPLMVSPDNILPRDYPTPCSILKCSHENVCFWRSLSIPCCEFCKCKGGNQYVKTLMVLKMNIGKVKQ